jgi:uncharacterized protein YodC (DUF2158 family)
MRNVLHCSTCKHYNQHKLGLKNSGWCPQLNILVSSFRISENCKWYDGYGNIAKSDQEKELEEDQEVVE